MDPLDKDGHTAILTDMASDYHQANAALKEARQGLVDAVADAKALGMSTADIVKITKWSRAQVQGIAAYSPSTTPPTDQAPVPTDQAAETSHDPADATA
jgi:hypothetical protein